MKSLSMSVLRKRRLLTVEDYHRMGEVGILPEKGLELIQGEIIEKNLIGSKHASIVEKVNDLLRKALDGRAMLRVQNPIIIEPYSEPEPDLAVVKYRSDYYINKHPEPEDVFLLIEVADSSIDFDRKIKSSLYAEASIPAYWIIDLENKQIETFSLPEGDVYSQTNILKKGDQIELVSFKKSIKVEDILI